MRSYAHRNEPVNVCMYVCDQVNRGLGLLRSYAHRNEPVIYKCMSMFVSVRCMYVCMYVYDKLSESSCTCDMYLCLYVCACYVHVC